MYTDKMGEMDGDRMVVCLFVCLFIVRISIGLLWVEMGSLQWRVEIQGELTT